MTSLEPVGTPARPLLLRRLNARTVLDMIRDRGPVSRAEIARTAGISKPTVSLALKALLEAGLVREASGADTDGPTYGATFYESDPAAAAAIGIDIGARYLRVAVADVTGSITAREDVVISDHSAKRVLALIPKVARRLMTSAGVPAARVAGAVVGVPGVVDPQSGAVSLAENVPGLEGQPVADRLGASLEVPVEVLNDVNLAAIGERDAGAGRGVRSFVFVSVGTGLGAGVVVNGELLAGSHGAAGELDLMRPAASGSDPSAPAIRAYAAALRRDGAEPAPDTVEIFARAREGDVWALGIVAEVARRVCAHLVPIAAIVDPELIVLGGGVGSNGDLLLPRLQEMLAEALPFPPTVQTSQLRDDAVLAGALALGVANAHDWSFAQHELAWSL
jgi:predicted NBD/HSP70 family sugar kinase